MGRLHVIFVTLSVLVTLWGTVSSSPLDPPAPVNQAPQLDKQHCPSCFIIDTACYNHTHLFQLNAPFGDTPAVHKMAVMHSYNILYYTFKPTLDDPEYSKAAYVSLDFPKYDNYSQLISGRQTFNFTTLSISQQEKEVYLGGSDGIWSVSPITSSVPEYVTAKGDHITNVVCSENSYTDYTVYFTKQDHLGLFEHYTLDYYVEDLWLDYLAEDSKINEFEFGKPDNMVYLNDTGLWFIFLNTSTSDIIPVRQTVRISPERFIRGLAVDAAGTVYAWDVNGIYKVVLGDILSETTLRKVSGIVPDAMTFDKANNIIYSFGKSLYKLTKVAFGNCNKV